MKGTKILSILLVGVIAVSVLARVAQIPVASPKLPAPTYDSGWVQIDKNQTEMLNHNIGGDIDNYMVDMQCKCKNQSYPDGNISNTFFGGDMDKEGKYRGTKWFGLNKTSISVVRFPDDFGAEEIRIRIWVHN